MENKKEDPSYYAIIPANVRYDSRLTANAKLLYGEITALCNDKGYCWATNEYFAKLYNVSKVSISGWIKNLADCGYIHIELDNSNKENLKRYLSILNGGIKENFNTGIKENFKYNNTRVNNTVNNKDFSGLVEQNFESEKMQNALKVWLDHKKQKRQSYTEIGFKKLISKIKKDIDAQGEQYVLDAIDYSLEQNYAGIYPKPTIAKAQPKKEYMRHNYSAEALQEKQANIEDF